MEGNILAVDASSAGGRLDKYLLKYFNKAPKAFVYKMIRKKRIKLNGKKAEGNEILKAGDELSFYLSAETMDHFMEERPVPVSGGQVEIIYEDENLLLLNKPRNLPTQPEKTGEDCLSLRALGYLAAIGAYKGNKGEVFTPGPANRLDRNTSGIVVFGKNPAAQRELVRVIRERLVRKFYIAVAAGRLEEHRVYEGLLAKGEGNFVKPGEGKYARTEVWPVKIEKEFTVVKVEIVTGRSHQIRVHLSEAGHPVAGDAKYGDSRVNRVFREKYGVRNMLLHGYEMELNGLTGILEYLNGKSFRADVPGDMERFIMAEELW